jgi:hypothetical protein
MRVRANRREHVGQDFAVNRDKPVFARQRPRFIAGGSAVSHLVSSDSAPLSAVGPERKPYQIAAWCFALAFMSRCVQTICTID